jgi:ABC-type uncharacterized transport system ATPase subunit
VKLELSNVTKRFGAVVANDEIDLTIEPGEVHCLLGENGAGKSTLMNLLFGVAQPDAGEIRLDGRPVRFSSPRAAIEAGIGMVHQHFTLVPTLTVAENVMLGYEQSGRLGWLRRRRAHADVDRLAEEYGLAVPPDATVGDLPVGLQQRVEIMKALRRDARLLILDEPTAVLTPQEAQRLFEVMRQLRGRGRSVIFISHKLREVRAVADRITVIRRGRVIGQAGPHAGEAELASMMVGRPVELRVSKPPSTPGPVALRLEAVSLDDEDGRRLIDGVALTVREGEVLALAGVQGNGQSELVSMLLGHRRPTDGAIRLGDLDVGRLSPREVLAAGIGYVPEDRRLKGLVGGFSVTENLILDTFDRPPFASGARLRLGEIARHGEELMRDFDIRAATPATAAGALSGGNAQKVVLARELTRELRLLVAVEPTRGLDVGSVEFVYRRLLAALGTGTAIVLVSSDLDEIVALADRIAVLYRGRVVGVVPPDVSRAELGLMMAGIAAGAAA